MGYSGKIDVMIDFIEFESFWFHPTVHDISNNFYGFSKLQFSRTFHNFCGIAFGAIKWDPYFVFDNIRHQFWSNILKTYDFDRNWAF